MTSVAIFHLGLVSTGYLGVDLFFVISGFLVSAQLDRKYLSEGSRGIRRFLVARSTRLIPALAVMVAAVSIFAFFVLPAGPSFQVSIETGISSLLLTSNFYLASATGGYFDVEGKDIFFLNLWSLSMEEQFLIIAAAVALFSIASAKQNPFERFVRVSILLGGLSAAAWFITVFALGNDPFFDPLLRFWQFSAGVISYWFSTKIQIQSLGPKHTLGLRLISVSAILVMATCLFAGHLIPGSSEALLRFFLTTSATVALFTLGADGIEARALCARPLVAIGDYSYSVYLWHWPAIVLAVQVFGPTPTARVFGLGAGMIAAVLSKRLVEDRSRSSTNRFLSPTVWLGALLGVGLLAAWLHSSSKDFQSANSPNFGLSSACSNLTTASLDKCESGEEPWVLLWGDSYAMHLAQALQAKEIDFIQRTMSVCSPIPGIAPRFDRYDEDWASECFSFNQAVLAELGSGDNRISHVVLSSPWRLLSPGYPATTPNGPVEDSSQIAAKALSGLVTDLEDLGLSVSIVGPTPQVSGQNPAECVLDKTVKFRPLAECDFSLSEISTRSTQQSLEEALEGQGKAVDLADFICKVETGMCKAHFQGSSIYRDYGHLSTAGSRWLGMETGFVSYLLSPGKLS